MRLGFTDGLVRLLGRRSFLDGFRVFPHSRGLSSQMNKIAEGIRQVCRGFDGLRCRNIERWRDFQKRLFNMFGHNRRTCCRKFDQRTHLFDEILRLKGFRDEIISAAFSCLIFIKRLEGSDKEEQWRIPDDRIATHLFTDLVPILAWHQRVHEHDGGPDFPCLFESCVPVVHDNKIILLIGEDDPDNLLDGDAVIGKKN